MTVSVPRFLNAYPEFRDTEYQLVEQRLNLATLRISTDAFGDLVDDGIMLLAAHLLSISPSGEKARLVKDETDTIYNRELTKMKIALTAGLGRLT